MAQLCQEARLAKTSVPNKYVDLIGSLYFRKEAGRILKITSWINNLIAGTNWIQLNSASFVYHQI